jgi:nucleoside-diphosphate-sugar epimerase
MRHSSPQLLVTGGAGFVGRNVVVRLVEDFPDACVWIIDDLSTGLAPLRWPEGKLVADREADREGMGQSFRLDSGEAMVRFIQADALSVFLGELGRVPRWLPKRLPAFDRIYHLSSVVGGRALIEGDPLAVGVDLAIDSAFFLWAAKVNQPSRILYASSSAAYPVSLQSESGPLALEESMIDFDRGTAQPDFTYGWSKLTGEYLGRIAACRYGLKVGVVRPFSGYGEYQEPVYPVPAIALRAAAQRDPLYVWGTGEQTRDFIHIDDCVEAMERAITCIEDGSAVNIGSGKPTTFLELAALMAEIVGYSPRICGKVGRPVGVAQRYCEPTLLREMLGFVPRISLREGMSRVVAVAKERLSDGIEIPE